MKPSKTSPATDPGASLDSAVALLSAVRREALRRALTAARAELVAAIGSDEDALHAMAARLLAGVPTPADRAVCVRLAGPLALAKMAPSDFIVMRSRILRTY